MDSNTSLLLYCSSVLITVFLLILARPLNQRYGYTKSIMIHDKKIFIVKRSVFLWLSFFPMWYLLAFRNINVGNDTKGTYYRIFKALLHNSSLRRIKTEVGYYYLNGFISKYTSSYHVLLIIIGTISWFLFYRYICKNSDNPALSVVIFFLSFFYFRQYNGIRQLLAEGIVLQGLKYVYERKLIKYIAVILLAFTFHNSVIVLLPIYFLYNVRLDTVKIAIVLVVSKLASAFLISFFLPMVLYGTKYYRIIYDIRAYKGGYWFSDIIISLFLLALCFVHIDKNYDKKFNLNTWLILIAAVIALNSNIIPLPGRLLWYAYINVMVFVPMLIRKYTNVYLRWMVSFSILVLYIAYFYQQWSLGIEGVQIYRFWAM